ncbi:G-box-binding factor isoform X2, partial [Brachionus plicatilis]
SIIEDPSEAGNSFQLNVEGNDSVTPKPKRRGRPAGSKNKKKTPVSIEWEVSQSRVMRIRTNDPIGPSNRVGRNLGDQLELIESVSTDEPPNPNISRAIRDRIRREIETPEQIADRLTRNFERERNIRAKETPEQTLERQPVQAQLQRERRANETNDVLNVRLNNEASSIRIRRANETPVQTANRKRKDAERQKNKRANETPAQRAERLQKNRDYYARQKANETPQQRMDRLGLNHEQRREQRHNLATHMLWSIPRHTVVVTDDQ